MNFCNIVSSSTILPRNINSKLHFVDSSGIVWVLYGIGTSLYLSKSNTSANETWNSPGNLNNSGSTPTTFGAVIDSNDKICIVWVASGSLYYRSTSDGVNYSTLRSFSLAGGVQASEIAVAIGSDDVVHVCYKAADTYNKIYHHTVDDTGWAASPTLVYGSSGEVYTFCSIAAYSTNKLVIAFENAISGGSKEIYSVRSGDAGATWQSAQPIYAVSGKAQIYPFVTAGTDGTFVMTWQGQPKYGRTYSQKAIFTKSLDYGANWTTPDYIDNSQALMNNNGACQALCISADDIYVISPNSNDFAGIEEAPHVLWHWDGVEWDYQLPLRTPSVLNSAKTIFMPNRILNNKLGLVLYIDQTTDVMQYVSVPIEPQGTFDRPSLLRAGEDTLDNIFSTGYNNVVVNDSNEVFVLTDTDNVFELYKSTDYKNFSPVSKLLFNGAVSVPYATTRSPNQDVVLLQDGSSQLLVWTCDDNEPQVLRLTPDLVFPYTFPGNQGSNTMGWSPNGNYVAIATGTSPYIDFFKSTGNGMLTRLTTNAPNTAAAGAGDSVAWSSNSTYCALAHATTPFLTFFKNNGDDTFTKLTTNAPNTAPPSAGTAVAWSPNGTYVAFGTATSTGRVKFYKNNGDDTFTLLTTNAPNSQPSATPVALEWSPDNTYLALISASAIQFFKNNGNDTFTKLTTNAPDTSITNTQNMRWSPTGTYLAVSTTGTPFLHLYKNNGDDTFTKQSNPSVLPYAGNGPNPMEWSADEAYLYTFAYFSNNVKMSPMVYHHSAGTLTIDDNYYKYFPNRLQDLRFTPNMVIDSNGIIHIVDYGKSIDSTTYYRVNYTQYWTSNSSWMKATYRIGGVTNLGATSHASGARIAIDGNDNLYVVYACVASGATQDQIKFTKSTDVGATWSNYIECGTITGYAQSGAEIVVDSSGTYVHVMAIGRDATYTTNEQIHYWRSSDGGATFAAVATIDAGATSKSKLKLAINSNDELMIVYMKSNDTYYSVSTDDGANWSAPATVISGATSDARFALGSPKGQTGFYFSYNINNIPRLGYRYYSTISDSWSDETLVTDPLASTALSAILSFGNKMVQGKAPVGLLVDDYTSFHFALLDNLSTTNTPPELVIATAEMSVPSWSINGGSTPVEFTPPEMIVTDLTFKLPTASISEERLLIEPSPMKAIQGKLLPPYLPGLVRPTTYTIEILEYQSTQEAEANTDDNSIYLAGHTLAEGDMIVNTDRRSSDTLGNRGSRRVDSAPSGIIELADNITGQVAGDSIRLYKYVDRTGLIKPGTFKLMRKGAGQSQLDFQIATTASYLIKKGQYVRVRADYLGTEYFAFWGFVSSHDEVLVGAGQSTIFQSVSCQNLNAILSRRSIEIDEAEGVTYGSIVQKMFDNYLFSEGILAGTIDTGATLLEDWSVEVISIGEVLDECASKSGYEWFIDDEATLQFYQEPASVANAPHAIRQDVTQANAWRNYFNLKFSSNALEYFNKMYFAGGKDENGNDIVLYRNDTTEMDTQQGIAGGTGVYGSITRDSSLVETNYKTSESGSTTTTINVTGHGQSVGDVVWNYTRDEYREVLTTPSVDQFTVSAFSNMTAESSATAEAGTTTTNIKITGHGMSDDDVKRGVLIYNSTRNAYRWVLTRVDADNFTVLSVGSQTDGDTIKYSGDVIAFFDTINDRLHSLAKKQSVEPTTVSFSTPENFNPRTKLLVDVPELGRVDEYYIIDDVEIIDLGAGLSQCWYNVKGTRRNNSNFTSQRKLSYKDYWRDF